MTGQLLVRDARNRAWRTILQAFVATMLLPAGDAALQVVQRSLVDSAAGKPFDWRQVAMTAAYSAGTGVVMAWLAYLHRAKVDPSAIPSALPPYTGTSHVSVPK